MRCIIFELLNLTLEIFWKAQIWWPISVKHVKKPKTQQQTKKHNSKYGGDTQQQIRKHNNKTKNTSANLEIWQQTRNKTAKIRNNRKQETRNNPETHQLKNRKGRSLINITHLLCYCSNYFFLNNLASFSKGFNSSHIHINAL